MNPAALSPFVDVFAMGDGERLVPRIAELLAVGPRPRRRFSTAAAKLPGLFVPAVHGARAEAAENAKVVIQQPMSRKDITPEFEVPHTTILTPRTELADKLLIEISRGLHGDVPLLLGGLRDGAGQAVPGRRRSSRWRARRGR